MCVGVLVAVDWLAAGGLRDSDWWTGVGWAELGVVDEKLVVEGGDDVDEL